MIRDKWYSPPFEMTKWEWYLPPTAAAIIIALVISCTPAQIAATQVKGQLFCARATPTVPLVVALADAAGGPISVIGLAASTVAAACAAWAPGAVPVTPPPVPSAAPLVAAPIAPAAVKAGA